MATERNATYREPWNKGKIVGQKAPFKLKDIWALRVRFGRRMLDAAVAIGRRWRCVHT